MRNCRIFIDGYFGYKNTGDDAIIYTLLKLVNEKKTCKFSICSLQPFKVPIKLEKNVSFVKPSKRGVIREILRSSAFLLGGGTSIHDCTPFHTWFEVLTWILFSFFWAKICRKKVYIIGNGIGPLSSRKAIILAKLILGLSDFISVRDRFSYELAKQLTNSKKISLAFDPSILLETNKTVAKEVKKSKILGLTLVPYFSIFKTNELEKDNLLVKRVSNSINDLLSQNPDMLVRFFIFHGKSNDGDETITKLLYHLTNFKKRVTVVTYQSDPTVMLSKIAECDFFIGTHFHSILFAYINNLPVLTVNYHDKCMFLAKTIGLPEDAVISPEEIIEGKLPTYLDNLVNNCKHFIPTLPLEVAKARARNFLLPF